MKWIGLTVLIFAIILLVVDENQYETDLNLNDNTEFFKQLEENIGDFNIISWAHEITDPGIEAFCVAFAQQYELLEVFNRAKEHNIRYIENGSLIEKNRFGFRNYCDALGLKTIYKPGRRYSIEGVPVDNKGNAFLMDSVVQDAYIERVKMYLTQYKKYIWAVMTGDEIQNKDFPLFLELYDEGHYAELYEEINEEVIKNFGDGVWGLPKNIDDSNPFRWIAYRKWYNNEYAKFQRRLYSEVKKIDSEILVISSNPRAKIQPLEYAAYSNYCDIMTHQVYIRTPEFYETAWITKTMVDLSSKRVMPCIHVERYSKSFSPEEVNSIMSQVILSGGNGYHLYMPDTAGKNKAIDFVLDRFGAWDRWNTVSTIIDKYRYIDQPDLPGKQLGLLFSNESYMAISKGGLQQKYDPYKSAFVLLGPYCSSWFDVISDTQIHSGSVNLEEYEYIILPESKYMSDSIYIQLLKYCRSGGILICLDKEGFKYDTGGHRREWKRDYSIEHAVVFYNTNDLQIYCSNVRNGKFLFLENDQMLKGPPFSEEYVDIWEHFLKAIGIDSGFDIWKYRFKIDEVDIYDFDLPDGKCLTGNSVVWIGNSPDFSNNQLLVGSCSYSRAPDLYSDSSTLKEIKFEQGDLFDRASAIHDSDRENVYEKYAVGWDVSVEAAVKIHIKFDRCVTIRDTRLFFAGYEPAIEFYKVNHEKTDGCFYEPNYDMRTDYDFPMIHISVPGNGYTANEFIIELSPKQGQPVVLTELELWGISN